MSDKSPAGKAAPAAPKAGRKTSTPEQKAEAARKFKAKYGYDLADETKAQKFARVGVRRAEQVRDAIENLKNVARSTVMEGTPEQWGVILETIRGDLADLEAAIAGSVKATREPIKL